MPMYNLLQYSKSYKKTKGTFWNYYRDEPNSGIGGENNNVNYSIKDSKPFDYKTSKVITQKKKTKLLCQLKQFLENTKYAIN